jgi:predicted acyltransferase
MARQIQHNLQIIIAAKLMVKLKNLLRQKDGPGPFLEDANITQHLSLNGKLQHQERHLYSGAGAYKRECGGEILSQSAAEHHRVNIYCGARNKNKKPATPIHCGQ